MYQTPIQLFKPTSPQNKWTGRDRLEPADIAGSCLHWRLGYM